MKQWLGLAAFGTTIAGFLCSLLGNYFAGKQQKEAIREEVEKQFSEMCKDEEDED